MSYRLCLDVKTNRVIYYTQDPTYCTPADTDHYLLAEIADLPTGITLQTCWQWRFKSGELVRETVAGKKPTPVATLLEQNKAALLKQLNEKLTLSWNSLKPWHRAAMTSEQQAACAARFIETQAMFSSEINAAQSQANIDSIALDLNLLTVKPD